MDDRNPSDAETRALLLKEARALMAENAKFSIKTLLTRTNISRADFRRLFTGKAGLVAALANEGVKDLNQILVAAQPVAVEVRKAVGAPEPVAAPAPTDQWLERRLRVFERALSAMEKRQEKSEQNLFQQVALLNERLTAPQPALVTEPVRAPEIPAVRQPAPEPVAEAEPDLEPELELERPAEAPELSAAVLAHVEKIQNAAADTVSEKEMADFLAHARQAVRNAALAEPAPPKARNTPVLAWGGAAAALLLLLGLGLLLAGHALGHNAQPVVQAGAGVSHRHVAGNGVPRLMALADSGDATAQTVLALDYLRGVGVTNDDAAARRWSEAAAAQGQPVAEYLLGTLYLEGNQDASQAVKWFDAAARQGNIKAMHNLAIAYAQGSGIAKDSVQAATWFVRAAEQGYRDSEFDLGVLYERGEGVPQDPVAALKWYRIAAKQGDAVSAARAQFLMTQMKAAEVNAAMDEATAFVPKPPAEHANQAPVI